MRISQYSLIAIIAIMIFNSGQLNGQDSRTCKISGRVLLELELYGLADPISGNRVILNDEDGLFIADMYTDAGGNFVFDNLLPGSYTLVKENTVDFATLFDGDYEPDGDRGDYELNDDEIISVELTPGEHDFGNYFVGLEASNGNEGSLPVEFSKVNAQRGNDSVLIEWSTITELNNDAFEIERSFDGQSFEVIGEVKGNGTTNQAVDYSFVDYSADNSTLYYRIKQIDFDGQTSYSDIVSVDAVEATAVEVFPTNVDTYLTVKGINNEVRYEVYNRVGQSVATGYTTKNIDMSTLNTGIYIVRLTDMDGNLLTTEKVFK